MNEDERPKWRRRGPTESGRCGSVVDAAAKAGGDDELEARLAELVGKRILVGITSLTPDGELIEQRQSVGTIVRATAEDGIEIEQEDGSGILSLPPDPNHVEVASPGHYRLRSTGQVVVDPDVVAMWEITKGPDG